MLLQKLNFWGNKTVHQRSGASLKNISVAPMHFCKKKINKPQLQFTTSTQSVWVLPDYIINFGLP